MKNNKYSCVYEIKRLELVLKLLLVLILIPGVIIAQNASKHRNKQMIFTCGSDKVLLLQTDLKIEQIDTLWKWQASETIGLPEKYLPILRGMDECKPSATGDTLLLTSSGGGVLMLERIKKQALFYAYCPAAHSAEYLPGNRIAIANSVNAAGNSIEIYDMNKPEKVLFRDSLYSGHGVVWLSSRQRLYALGYKELKAYSLKDWNTDKPSLKLEKIWEIPEQGGHDLSKVTGDRLLLSTDNSVWEFDINTGMFSSFLPLEGVPNVKSVNLDTVTSLLMYTKGEIEWWTHQIHFQNPKGMIHVPQINMYKVRLFKKLDR